MNHIHKATTTDIKPTIICIQGVPPVRSDNQTYNFGIKCTKPPTNSSNDTQTFIPSILTSFLIIFKQLNQYKNIAIFQVFLFL